VISLPCAAHAQTPANEGADSAPDEFRAAFKAGVTYQKDQDWGRALAAFRKAASGPMSPRNASAITFNIGMCERAMGHFVAARQAWLIVLERPDDLDPVRATEAKRYLEEAESLLVRVDVTLEPESASLSVDGGPIEPDPREPGRFLAGLSHDATRIASPQRRTFQLWLDPGPRIFRANRPGHTEAVVEQSYREGTKDALSLRLDVLPAKIVVDSNPSGAIVRLDDRDVGPTPRTIERPAGRYQLEIEREDFNVHREHLELQPGQRVDIMAPLTRYEPPVTDRWWFWPGVFLASGLIATLTYIVVTPAPKPPPYDGGSSGWVAKAP
jgi:hypothetical protein